jgi:hypothetical protein
MFESFSPRLSLLYLVLFLLASLGSAPSRASEMTSTLIVSGSKIDITVEDRPMSVPQDDIIAWVKIAAESVAAYYHRYPVPHLTIHVIPFSGHGVRHGMTWGMHGGLIRIGLGSETTREELMDDWMMTHEMIHLAFPSVADEHHWIEEGLSTYVEPIARIRVNNMKEERMWADLIRDMPKGQPRDGDEGLDHTHTWGRTYWGGALFCFDADVKIRRQTHNKKGLEDALRGILDAGGDITHDWELEKAFAVGDRATGTTVLSDLYHQMKDHPMEVDLAQRWKDLGIEWDGTQVHLRDDAPDAAIRRAIAGAPGIVSGSATPRKSVIGPGATPVAVLAGRRHS